MGLLMGLELGMEERLVGCRGLDSTTLQLDREGISDDEKKKRMITKNVCFFWNVFFTRVGRWKGFGVSVFLVFFSFSVFVLCFFIYLKRKSFFLLSSQLNSLCLCLCFAFLFPVRLNSLSLSHIILSAIHIHCFDHIDNQQQNQTTTTTTNLCFLPSYRFHFCVVFFFFFFYLFKKLFSLLRLRIFFELLPPTTNFFFFFFGFRNPQQTNKQQKVNVAR